ncbi:Uncharacterized protein dnm_055210 [Desulfonema magnum]|uniref:Uncharacterized protein n=1 Tax=Desulfonema magnum TaxID=45655 RepID=A0A975BQ21_9BACT|nr:Uncharacterized protein dnm_055210 [Desulfonema magnum]
MRRLQELWIPAFAGMTRDPARSDQKNLIIEFKQLKIN